VGVSKRRQGAGQQDLHVEAKRLLLCLVGRHVDVVSEYEPKSEIVGDGGRKRKSEREYRLVSQGGAFNFPFHHHHHHHLLHIFVDRLSDCLAYL